MQMPRLPTYLMYLSMLDDMSIDKDGQSLSYDRDLMPIFVKYELVRKDWRNVRTKGDHDQRSGLKTEENKAWYIVEKIYDEVMHRKLLKDPLKNGDTRVWTMNMAEWLELRDIASDAQYPRGTLRRHEKAKKLPEYSAEKEDWWNKRYQQKQIALQSVTLKSIPSHNKKRVQ